MAERLHHNRQSRPSPYETRRQSGGSGPSSASGSSGRRPTPTRPSARPGSLGSALSGSPMTRSSSFPERAAASQPSLVRPQAALAHSGPMPSFGSASLSSGTAFQPYYYVPRKQADAQTFVQQQRSPYTIFPPSSQGGATSQPIAGQQTVTELTSVKLKRQKVLDSNGHETGQVVMMEADLQRAMGSIYVNTSLGAPPLPAGIPWGGPIEGVWQGPNTTATASYPTGGYSSPQQGNRPSNVGSHIPAGASRAPAQPTRSFRAHPSAEIASVDTTAIPAFSSHDIPRRPRSVVSNALSTPNSVQTPGTQYWGGNYIGSPPTFQPPVQGRTPPMQLFNRGLGSGASAINPDNPTAESSPAQRAGRSPTAVRVEEGEVGQDTISKRYHVKPRSLSMDSVVSNRSRLMEDATGGPGGPSTGVSLAYDPSTGHIRVVSDGEVFFMRPMTEEEERSIFHLKPREERQ